MKILTHPENVELVKRLCVEGRFPNDLAPLWGIQIQTSCHMDREKPTGRYILSDGRVVDRADICIPDGPYFEWDAKSDLELKLLLEWGLLRREMEPLFYVINDGLLRSMFDALPVLTVPPYVLINAV